MPLAHGVENGLQQALFLGQAQEVRLQAARVDPVQPLDQLVEKCRFHTVFSPDYGWIMVYVTKSLNRKNNKNG